MKCISLWDPWATLVVLGAKRLETRDWATLHRGPLLIHATKAFAPAWRRTAARQPMFAAALHAARLWDLDALPRGAIIGACELVDCIQVLEGMQPDRRRLPLIVPPPADSPEHAFGNYAPGRWAWVLQNGRRFETPIPWRGSQKMFNVPTERFTGELRRQLEAI